MLTTFFRPHVDYHHASIGIHDSHYNAIFGKRHAYAAISLFYTI